MLRNIVVRCTNLRLRTKVVILFIGLLLIAVATTTLKSSAATPASGTLTPANDSANPLTYTDGPLLVPNPTHLALGQPDCTGTNRCSDYTLTVNAASVAATKQIQIQAQWASTSTDFDLFVEDAGGNLIQSNASTADPSTIIIPIPANGTVYHIIVVLSVGAAQTFNASVSVIPIPPPAPQGAGAPPRYENYPAPQGVADNAGEPSIGVDWNPNVPSLRDVTPPTKKNVGGVTFFTSGANEFRSNFDDCCSPAVNLWEDISAPFTQQSALSDPIGFVDHYTSAELGLGGAQPQTPGRVFSIDLLGGQGNSAGSFSDDDGNNYLPGATGGPGQGPDHETLGGGPYSSQGGATPPAHPLYPNAIYYCSQNGAVEAQCSRSDDGGQTFGPGVPIFNTNQCTGGIHGHVKVARDGTVYVPNSSCGAGGADGVAVSRDNGMTWNEFNVPSSTGSQDPSVGIGQNEVGKPGGQASNTIYLGWASGDGHAHIATSHDQGATWVNDIDVGSVFGVQSAAFPVVVAGDDNRAAFGFLGTTTSGTGAYSDPAFRGIWHLFVATTYDGGQTYIVIDATPNDPVQTGEICLGGFSCDSSVRGLLDFNDFSVDAEGRPVLGYADGCVSCDNTFRGQSSSSHATIARQSGGRRLFAAFDPPEPAPPAAPQILSATRNANGVLVKWIEPDNGGSVITGYKVHRGATSGNETFLANVSGELNTAYQDTSANPANTYFYRVTAVNANGEGSFCREVTVTGSSSSSGNTCEYPYLTVDGPGHAGNVPSDPTMGELTIQNVNIGEPFIDCDDKSIAFLMKVSNLDPGNTGNAVLPENAEWQMLFNVTDTNGNPEKVFVAMDTFASNNASSANPNFTIGRRDPTATGTTDTQTCFEQPPLFDCPQISGSFSKDGTILLKLQVADPIHFAAPSAPATGTAFDWSASNPGTTLTSVTGNTFLLAGVFLETVQTTTGGNYSTVGNLACEVRVPPMARVTATPMSGSAPLNVSFDGSTSSEPNSCAVISNYTLDFGDGSPAANQVSPNFTHNYTCAGPEDCNYPARLTVTDSRSDTSVNQAQVMIHVTPGGGPSPSPTPSPSPASCTSPHSGTLSPSSGALNYCGGPFAVSNPTAPLGNTPPACASGTCDFFNLTVTIPAGDPHLYAATVSIGWTNSGSPTTQGGTASDFDLYVYKPDETGAKVGQGGGSTNPEIATFTATSGTYTVYVVPYDVQPDVAFNGTITLTQLVSPTPTPTPIPSPTPEIPGVPRYFNYAAPGGLGTDAGEPSIGVNWKSEQLFNNSMFSNIPNGGTSMFESSTQTLRVTFDDCPSPANSLWADKSAPNAATSLDPILFTDHGYNHVLPDPFRTFSSQLTGADSLTAYTDDDGENWTPSQGGGIPSGYDHQTIGAGPYNPNSSPAPPPHPLYPNAVYYCSQEDVTAFCARSDNGGLTFGPGVPAWNTTQCGGIHGHVKVAPDGTVYVPNWNCTPGQGVAVSTDNGVTWTVRNITGATKAKGLEDPSIGIGADNTLYFGYQNGDGHPHIAVSHDHGQTWVNNTDIGTPFGIRNAVYPAVTAGDGDRASMAFIGTTEPGDYVAQTNFSTGQGFQGVWHLYIATTFDGGVTWTTIDATPNDPVQRGSICDQGTVTCNRTPNDRNLLDFIVADTDKEGRVLVAYADGCIGSCVNGGPNSYSALGTIVRQAGGKRLFHEFDPVEPALPNAPRVSSLVRNNDNWVTAKWSAPDGNGASISGYKIYRGTAPGGETLLATVGNVLSYFDMTATAPGVTYYYKVSALNAQGEGPTCHEFTPTLAPPEAPSDPCVAPGVQILDDTSDSGQNTPPDGSVDVRQLYLAEFGTDTNQLTFRLQVAPSVLTSPPPNSQWFIIWNRQAPDADFDRMYVAMRTDASGVTSFEYGKFGVPIDTSGNGVPNPNSNTPVKLGDADSGTYDLATGVITIKLSNSNAENVHAGQTLSGLNVRTYINRPDPGQRSQNNASDITVDGDYTLVGNGACQLFTISGHVAYGIDNSKNVGSTTLTLTGGASPKTALTGADGNYTMLNVPINGTYTLTPSKPPTMNGLESFDASFVARWVAGLDPAPGTNQRIAADADDDGILTSFDAALIARKVAGLNDTGIVGTWKFNPAMRSYPSLSASQTSQDFDAILVGDTSGSWSGSAPAEGAGGNPPAQTGGAKQVNSASQTSSANRPSASGASRAITSGASAVIASTATQSPTVTIPVNLAHVAGAMNTDVNVPITVTDITGQGVKAYDLQVTYNPAIVQPAMPDPFDKTGTLSSGMLITPNANNSGHLIISAFQATDLSGAGVLLYLRFHVVGSPGQSTPLTFEDYTDPNPTFHPGFRFNSGTPQAGTTNGSLTVSGPTAAHNIISGRIVTGAGNSVGGVVLTLSGSSSARKAITNSQGDYRFTDVETGGFYTVTPTLANYRFSPADRSFSLVGDKSDAVFTASADATQTANAIDTAEYFVRQQYLDFLGREPDQGGFEYWSDQINQCQGDATCVRSRRIGVSAAFFIEQEFQQTGTFIYDLYKGTLGRRPAFAEYSADRQHVVGGANLDAEKSALAESFVQRIEFTSKYQANTTAESFVDALLQNALQSSGVDLSAQRDRYLSAYHGGGDMNQARGLVVRALADEASLKQAEHNRAFVLAQYFGYLRREPEDSGYNFWLNVLNSQPSNFRAMVCAFITSDEYQNRFGAVHTHSNPECSGSP